MNDIKLTLYSFLAYIIVARHPLVFRAAFFWRIPFQGVSAGACPGAAAVGAVVVGEGMALVTGIVVVV